MRIRLPAGDVCPRPRCARPTQKQSRPSVVAIFTRRMSPVSYRAFRVSSGDVISMVSLRTRAERVLDAVAATHPATPVNELIKDTETNMSVSWPCPSIGVVRSAEAAAQETTSPALRFSPAVALSRETTLGPLADVRQARIVFPLASGRKLLRPVTGRVSAPSGQKTGTTSAGRPWSTRRCGAAIQAMRGSRAAVRLVPGGAAWRGSCARSAGFVRGSPRTHG